MPIRTGSLESLRERNRLLVVDVLRSKGTASRADIARETGLSRSTVSSLVADLQVAGLVVERMQDGVGRNAGAGRPPIQLALDRSAGAVVGVDFGHRHLRVALSDLSYTILAETKVDLEVDHGGLEALDAAAHLIRALLDEAGIEPGRVLAAGMGLPAPIARATGRVDSRSILPGWVDLNPAEELERRLGVAVHLDNDANNGALGEWLFGDGRDARVLAYVRLSAGIGLGLIIDGRVFRGARGTAGEIGHVLADPDGPICRCGNRGCLETRVAGPALCDLLARSHGALTVDDLVQLALAGDAACRRVLADAGTTVGRALADVCNYLNPDLVVVGGELSAAGDLVVDPLREAIRRYAIPAAGDGLRVEAGVLRERAEVLGALTLAGHELEDPVIAPTPMSHQRRRTR